MKRGGTLFGVENACNNIEKKKRARSPYQPREKKTKAKKSAKEGILKKKGSQQSSSSSLRVFVCACDHHTALASIALLLETLQKQSSPRFFFFFVFFFFLRREVVTKLAGGANYKIKTRCFLHREEKKEFKNKNESHAKEGVYKVECDTPPKPSLPHKNPLTTAF